MNIPTSNLKPRSGLDELVERSFYRKRRNRFSRAPACVAADEATWDKYAERPIIELWQLVLLHSRIDPDYLGYDGFEKMLEIDGPGGRGEAWNDYMHGPRRRRTAVERLCRNALDAERALKAGELPIQESGESLWRARVKLSDFRAWTLKVKLAVVGHWPKRLNDRSEGVVYRFPHRTPHLRQFAALTRRIARATHGKWPINQVVFEAALRAGFPRYLARAVAALSRPPGKPRGRPKRQPASRGVEAGKKVRTLPLNS